MSIKGKKILGIGAALVDLLAPVSEEWIVEQGEAKGGMTLVDWPRMEALLQKVEDPEMVPGGSACNTIRGLGTLGGAVAFLSKVKDDELGKIFVESLKKSGVESLLGVNPLPTGRVLSAVTPDAERTMFSYMGASDEMTPDDINPQMLKDFGMVYLEGYIAFNSPWFRAVVQAAKDAGVQVGLDLGSVSVVEFCRQDIQWALDLGVMGLLVANEDEAKAWTGLEGRAALDALAQEGAKISVLKLGKKGSLIKKGTEVVQVNAQVVKAIDTTGAGDLWATGFLYGMQKSLTLQQCGELASLVASEVVQVMGAVIPAVGWERINEYLKGINYG